VRSKALAELAKRGIDGSLDRNLANQALRVSVESPTDLGAGVSGLGAIKANASKALLLHPDLSIFIVLLILFCLDICLVVYIGSGPSVAGCRQWAIGIVAIGIVLAIAAIAYVADVERIEKAETIASLKIKPGGAIASHELSGGQSSHLMIENIFADKRKIFLIVALAGEGGILYAATFSLTLLSVFLFMPAALYSASLLHQSWAARGYIFTDDAYAEPPRNRRNTLSPDSERNSTSSSAAPARGGYSTGVALNNCQLSNWRSGDFRRVAYPIALIRGGLSSTDTFTLVTALGVIISLSSCAIVASISWRYGWCISATVLEVIAAYFAGKQSDCSIL